MAAGTHQELLVSDERYRVVLASVSDPARTGPDDEVGGAVDNDVEEVRA